MGDATQVDLPGTGQSSGPLVAEAPKRYFPIHKITEIEALTRSIAVHTADIDVYEVSADERSLKPLEERWRSGESGPDSMPVESIRASTARRARCPWPCRAVLRKKSPQSFPGEKVNLDRILKGVNEGVIERGTFLDFSIGFGLRAAPPHTPRGAMRNRKKGK